MKSPDDQEACGDILQALMGLAYSEGFSAEVPIVFDQAWWCRWPRPSSKFGDIIWQMRIGAGGIIDMSPFAELQGAFGSSKDARQWHRDFFGVGFCLADSGSMTMADALRRAQGVVRLSAFVAQLVWAFAERFESCALRRTCSDSVARSPLELKANSISIADLDLSAKLYSYVQACKAHSAKFRVFGVATDKATPCAESLQNTTLTFADNSTAICCPNVALGDTFWQVRRPRRGLALGPPSLVSEGGALGSTCVRQIGQTAPWPSALGESEYAGGRRGPRGANDACILVVRWAPRLLDTSCAIAPCGRRPLGCFSPIAPSVVMAPTPEESQLWPHVFLDFCLCGHRRNR